MPSQFTAQMDRAAFIIHCRTEAAKRQKTARDTYQDYNLMLLSPGLNPNDPNSYAVCSPTGRVYQPRAGKTYLIGFVGKNGYRANVDQTELCPDEMRTRPLNERLVAMGEAAFVIGKHRAIRTLLFLDLPEVMPKSEVA